MELYCIIKFFISSFSNNNLLRQSDNIYIFIIGKVTFDVYRLHIGLQKQIFNGLKYIITC